MYACGARTIPTSSLLVSAGHSVSPAGEQVWSAVSSPGIPLALAVGRVNVSMTQKRAYRYRFYPTSEQANVLAQTFGSVRFVYNWALRLRTDAYYQRQERLGYHEASAALTALKQQSETARRTQVSSG